MIKGFELRIFRDGDTNLGGTIRTLTHTLLISMTILNERYENVVHSLLKYFTVIIQYPQWHSTFYIGVQG